MRVFLVLLAGCAAANAAEPFAASGTKAVLSVDYIYESAGSQSGIGGYDPYTWRVKRDLSMVAELAAQAPQSMPTVQPMDSAQLASLEGKAKKAQAMAPAMAPLMADMEKVMAKCGDNEACITREIEKLGLGMAGSGKVEAVQKTGKDFIAMAAPGAPRYQAWRATAQKGTYLIDEYAHVSNTDPICTGKPRHRCTREEWRKGGGDVPMPDTGRKKAAAAGISAVEVDTGKNTLTILPPVPLAPLPYTETIKTDEPGTSHGPAAPGGPQPKQAFFRVSAAGSGYQYDKPFVVPLKGGWRDQQGEQVVKLQGRYGDTGTLRVRWRFKVQ